MNHAKTTEAIERLYEQRHSLADIAAELDLDYDADEGLLFLPGYAADDGNCEVEYPDADSAEEAAREYVEDGDWGDWGDGDESFAINVGAGRVALFVDDDGDLDTKRYDWDGFVIVQHPDEPSCDAADDGEHRWANPHEMVGGIEENPGVWGGQGCSISTVEVCLLCGTAKVSRSNSQGSDTAHDHDSVRYGDDGHDVSIADLARYHDGRREVPSGLADDSKLAEVLCDLVDKKIDECGYGVSAYVSGRWIVPVNDESGDDSLDGLRSVLPTCSVEFTGDSNTDHLGRITSDISITWNP
jgi:hypothetical protein